MSFEVDMIESIDEIQIGDQVSYFPMHYKQRDIPPDIGIVKAFVDSEYLVCVVFDCGHDWNNYQNYTSSTVSIWTLFLDWKQLQFQMYLYEKEQINHYKPTELL